MRITQAKRTTCSVRGRRGAALSLALLSALALPQCTGGSGTGGAGAGGAAASSGGGLGSWLTGAKGPTFEAIKAAHAEAGKTPEGALRCWFQALYQYTSANAGDRAAGQEALSYLTIAFKSAPDWETRPSYRTFVDRCRTMPHIFRSYVRGATPANAYACDPATFELAIDRKESSASSDRGIGIFLRSGGADNPRPMYLKQSEQTGLWYVNAFDNVYLDVRPIPVPGKETFK